MLLDIVTKGSTDRSVVLRIIDSTDGTPETGVVFNTSGIDLWYRREAGASVDITEATLSALTDAHSDGGFLHVNDGYYRLDVPDAAFATSANYVDFGGTVTGMVVIGGRVRLVDFNLETATQNVNVTQLSGDSTAADNAEAFFDGTGYAGTNNVIPTVTTLNGLAANVITAASIATGAIDADAIAADAIGASELAADAVTEIANAVWDMDATGHQTGGTFGQAIGDPGASTETLFKAIITDPAGTNIAADIIAIKAETAAILDDTDDIGVAGAGLTAINLPNQTMDIVGNITGNLSGSVGSIGAAGIAAASFDVAAITASSIAANAITSSEVADGFITAAKIATDAIDADALAADALAELKAQIVAALNTDTYAEPGQGSPAATTTLVEKIGYIYKAWRNRSTQTATEYALYADDGATKDQEAGVTDDGVTLVRAEISTGA